MRVVLVLLLASCTRAASPQPNAGDASPTIAVAPLADASATAVATASASSSATSTVPIVVRGYPHEIRTGMNDPATFFGWTKDGALFGYCGTHGGRPTFSCELVDRDGKLVKKSDVVGNAEPDPKKKKELIAWAHENGFAEIPDNKPPPALVATWPSTFADITLDVARAVSAEKPPAVVRLGGSVGKDAPVHPFTLTKNLVPEAPPHYSAMNGMAVSPDGKELGVVAHFFACEYCDSFDVKRIPLTTLAASIYNDTGYRAHRRGDFARAAPLFEKAIAADPSHKLAQYNYACALAQQGDARAKDALAAAIAKDPSAKARAKTDKDFEKVKSEPWFVELVR